MNILIDVPANKWEKEYMDGKWDFLSKVSAEKARCSLIGMYCRHHHPTGKILDVGCGTGSLNEFLNSTQRENYLGIDFSQTAIDEATGMGFNALKADACFYTTEERFNVIVFNEVLYHLDYKTILNKYSKYLAHDGVIIISMFRVRSILLKIGLYKIWRWCRTIFSIVELCHLTLKCDGRVWKWDLWLMHVRTDAKK